MEKQAVIGIDKNSRMPFLELFDETLDINSTENYELSVEVNYDTLSFSILDTLRNKFILLRSYDTNDDNDFDVGQLGELILKDDFLTKRYRKINLIIPSERSTMVPAPLYDESKKDDYFTFNLIKREGDIILTNELPDPDTILIFSLPAQIVEFLRSIFGNNNLNHHLKPIFRYISSSRRNAGNYYLHVHFEKYFFNLIVYDQSTLKFCNTFEYKTISDVQYYVLYVLKRLNISQQETLFFSGRTNNLRDLEPIFSNYLKTVKFAEPAGNFTFSYVFNNIELHRFLNLFIVTGCE
jgi:hypothetical protein